VFSESDLEEERFGVACGAGRQGARCPGESGLVDGRCDVEVPGFIGGKAFDSLIQIGIGGSSGEEGGEFEARRGGGESDNISIFRPA
jgi:hypothetical protein